MIIPSKSLKISRGFTAISSATCKRGAAFGSFDGLHLGHQALINHLIQWKQQGENREAWLLSLYPHPLQIIKGIKVKQIISFRQSKELLAAFSIDRWHLLRFSKQVANMRALDFINRVFNELCQLDYLVIGPDAAVGFNRTGSSAFIKESLERHGCEVQILKELQSEGAKIGSRYIRAAIEAGDPQRAKELLGRPFIIEGKVKKGASRGRTIGFRTANISLENYVVPQFGVYVVKVALAGQVYNGLANVGVRPTFADHEPLLEVHVLDYQGPEFYQARLTVEFIKRLRPEQKFQGVQELREQIIKDVAYAKEYFVNNQKQ